MSETAVQESVARVFAVPEASGKFALGEYEVIDHFRPSAAVEIQIIEQGDGWRAAALATLVDGGFGGTVSTHCSPFPTRAHAIADACDQLIAYCGEQKERGKKKHRESAEAVQEWAMELERRELATVTVNGHEASEVSHESPVTPGSAEVMASPEAGPSSMETVAGDFPGEACGRCGIMMLPLMGGTRHGLLVCPGCDIAEIEAHRAEGALMTPAQEAQSLAEMNAPGDKPATQEAIVRAHDDPPRTALLDDLHPSPLNPRQHFPEAAMAELVESMRSSGFRPWLAIVARPRPEGGYEIGAGHRRARAARLAGLKEVPVFVREMADAEFLDVLNFDNSGREDVHPLHEAAGWRIWMEKTGGTVLDIAARIGQSKEYVYDRLKYAALIEPVRVAFMENRITARHALIIARLAESLQDKALEEGCFRRDWAHGKWGTRQASSRELSQWIADQKSGANLADAAFDRDDADLLPSAGACVACPKRVEDLCTDRACFDAKVEAKIQGTIKAGFIAISTAYDPKEIPAGLVTAREFEELEEAQDIEDVDEGEEPLQEEQPCQFAEAAIVAHGPDRGKVKRICRHPECPVHGRGLQRQAGPARTAEGKKDFWAEQAKALPAKIERESRRAVLRAVLAKPLPWSLPHDHLQLLALALLPNGVDPVFLDCLNLPIGVKKCEGTSAVAAELKRLIVAPKGSPASDHLARIAFGLTMHEVVKDYCWSDSSDIQRLHKAATLLAVDEGRIGKEVADRMNADFKAKRDKAKAKQAGPAAKTPPAKPQPAPKAEPVKPKASATAKPAAPPADARKSAIGKLPALGGGPAGKNAKPAAKKPAPPAKKAPAKKAPAKKSAPAKKGGKK